MKKKYIIIGIIGVLFTTVVFFAGIKYREYRVIVKTVEGEVDKPVKIVRSPKIDRIQWCPFWGKYCYIVKP